MSNLSLRIDQEDAEHLIWLGFFMELSQVNSHDDVLTLLRKQPLLGAPGRGFFANLGLFMQCYEISPDAKAAELTQYLRIIRKLGPTLDLPPLALPLIQENLMKAITARYPHYISGWADNPQ